MGVGEWGVGEGMGGEGVEGGRWKDVWVREC